MYHHFIPSTSEPSLQLSNKLSNAIGYYKTLPNHQQPSIFTSIPTITITHSIHNPMFDSFLFILSNNKMLRYGCQCYQNQRNKNNNNNNRKESDKSEKLLEQIKQLDGVQVLDVKVLNFTGRGNSEERYVLLTDSGVVVLGVGGRDIRRKEEEMERGDVMEGENMGKEITQERQQDRRELIMEEQKRLYQQKELVEEEMIELQEQQQPIPQYQQLPTTSQQQQHPYHHQPHPLPCHLHQTPFSPDLKTNNIHPTCIFVVEGSNSIGKKEAVDDKAQSKQGECEADVLVVVAFDRVTGVQSINGKEVAVYRVEVWGKCETMTERQVEQYNNTSSSHPFNITITPIPHSSILLPTIPLSLCTLPIPDFPTLQQQQLNPIQVIQSHIKHSKRHPIITCDHYITSLPNNTLKFSLYLTTQVITHDMEAGEYRHCVFQYGFVVKMGQGSQGGMVIGNGEESSPVYEYPERRVMCAVRVFMMPLTEECSVVRYCNVTKKVRWVESEGGNGYQKDEIISNNNNIIIEETNQPQHLNKTTTTTTTTYTITTITTLQSNRTEIQQFSLSFPLHLLLPNTPTHLFNPEHRLFHCHLSPAQNVVLREVLLLDVVRKYGVLLVDQGGVRVGKRERYDDGKLRRSKIVVVDLRGKDQKKEEKKEEKSGKGQLVSKRIVAEHYLLQHQSTDKLSSIILTLSSTSHLSHPSHSTFRTHSQPSTFLPNSLNLPKTIHLIHLPQSTTSPQASPIYHSLKLIPKSLLYHRMLQQIFADRMKTSTRGTKGQREKRREGKLEEEETAFIEEIVGVLGV